MACQSCKASQTLQTSQTLIPAKKKEVVQETLKMAITTPSRVEQLAIVSSWVFSLGPRCSPKNSPSLVPFFSILLYFCPTHEQSLTHPSVLRKPKNDPISSNRIFLPVLGAVLSKVYTLTHSRTLWNRFYDYLRSQMRGCQRRRLSPTEPQVGRTLCGLHPRVKVRVRVLDCSKGRSWLRSGSNIHRKLCCLGRQLGQRCIFLKVQEKGRLPVRLALHCLSYEVIK